MINDDNASAQFTKSSTFVVSVVTEVLNDGSAPIETIQLPGIGNERIKYILTTPRDGDQGTLGTQNLMVGTLVPASANDAKKSRDRYLATSLFIKVVKHRGEALCAFAAALLNVVAPNFTPLLDVQPMRYANDDTTAVAIILANAGPAIRDYLRPPIPKDFQVVFLIQYVFSAYCAQAYMKVSLDDRSNANICITPESDSMLQYTLDGIYSIKVPAMQELDNAAKFCRLCHIDMALCSLGHLRLRNVTQDMYNRATCNATVNGCRDSWRPSRNVFDEMAYEDFVKWHVDLMDELMYQKQWIDHDLLRSMREHFSPPSNANASEKVWIPLTSDGEHILYMLKRAYGFNNFDKLEYQNDRMTRRGAWKLAKLLDTKPSFNENCTKEYFIKNMQTSNEEDLDSILGFCRDWARLAGIMSMAPTARYAHRAWLVAIVNMLCSKHSSGLSVSIPDAFLTHRPNEV